MNEAAATFARFDGGGLGEGIASAGFALFVREVHFVNDDDAGARGATEVARAERERDEGEQGDGRGRREDAARDVGAACGATTKHEARGEEQRGEDRREAPGLLGGEADDEIGRVQ